MSALLAVEEIVNDLSDRRGLGHEWGSIDDESQSEIMDTWRVIVEAHISEAVAAERERIKRIILTRNVTNWTSEALAREFSRHTYE